MRDFWGDMCYFYINEVSAVKGLEAFVRKDDTMERMKALCEAGKGERITYKKLIT